MTKKELIEKIYREFSQSGPRSFTRAKAEAAVGAIFEDITEALARGDRVELRGFGTFSVRQYDARVGRDPRNGEAVAVPETHHVYFRPGKPVSIRINGGDIN